MANAFRVRDENGADGGRGRGRVGTAAKSIGSDNTRAKETLLSGRLFFGFDRISPISRRSHSTRSRSPHPKHPTMLHAPPTEESTTNGEESKQAQKPTREGGRGPTNVGGTAGSAGGREGKEGEGRGGSQPTGHLSEAPIKYPAKNISRDLWLLSKGENTLEKLSQTLQGGRESERVRRKRESARTQTRTDRHARPLAPPSARTNFRKVLASSRG